MLLPLLLTMITYQVENVRSLIMPSDHPLNELDIGK